MSPGLPTGENAMTMIVTDSTGRRVGEVECTAHGWVGLVDGRPLGLFRDDEEAAAHCLRRQRDQRMLLLTPNQQVVYEGLLTDIASGIEPKVTPMIRSLARFSLVEVDDHGVWPTVRA